MNHRIRTFKNYGLRSVDEYTFLLLKIELINVNEKFFWDHSEEAAEDLFRLLERWRKRKK